MKKAHQKSETVTIIEEMSKGTRSQDGRKFNLHGRRVGRPLILHEFAFNQSMYTEVAQHLFHWDNNEGTNKPRDMKSYFTNAAPFAAFTSTNNFASPTKTKKKRKSNGATYPS